MNASSFKDHPFLIWLVVWRALLALIALYSVLTKPFEAMLLSVATLALLFLIGEAVYKSVVYLELEKLRRQKDQALRERRAEEARLRFEQMQKERQGRSSMMSLDED